MTLPSTPRRPLWRSATRSFWMRMEALGRGILFYVWKLRTPAYTPDGAVHAANFAVIIACYQPRRLRNLAPLIRNALRSPRVGQVVLTCHNPALHPRLPNDLQTDRVRVMMD